LIIQGHSHIEFRVDLEVEHNEMMLVPMSMPNMHHPSFSMKSDIRRAILWQSNMAVQIQE